MSLEEVSTTRGSGWVNQTGLKINNNIAIQSSTHPLPQVVLTSSKCIPFLMQRGWR